MNKVLKIKVQNFKTFEAKADGESGIVEAYVSIFGNVDLAGEVIDKGAFAQSLARKLPKVVWSHDWQQPIGVVLEAREDEKGLYVKFQFVKGVQKADEALALMQAQGGDGKPAIDEFSIGYQVMEDYMGQDGFRHLKTIQLYEVSPVLVGCNQETELLSVKGADGVLKIGKGIEKEIPEEAEEEKKTEEAKADPVEGDPCTMEDGTEGEMHPNADGAMVCMPKKEAPKPEEKVGKVLSAANRALVEKAVADAEQFSHSIEAVITPLKELLEATAENTGGKVEPTTEDTKNVIRIRQAVKQADRALGYVLRITKS